MTSSVRSRKFLCTNPAVPISSVASYLGYKQSRLALLFAYSCSFIRFLNSSNSSDQGSDCCSLARQVGQSLSLPAAVTRASRHKVIQSSRSLNYGPTPSPTVVAGPVLGIYCTACVSLYISSMNASPNLCLPPCTPTSPFSRLACTSCQDGAPQAASELARVPHLRNQWLVCKQD